MFWKFSFVCTDLWLFVFILLVFYFFSSIVSFTESPWRLLSTWWDVAQLVSDRKRRLVSASLLVILMRHLLLKNYLITVFVPKMDQELNIEHLVLTIVLCLCFPHNLAAYLHVNLIIWPFALWSTQTAKVSCFLTSDAKMSIYTHKHDVQTKPSRSFFFRKPTFGGRKNAFTKQLFDLEQFWGQGEHNKLRTSSGKVLRQGHWQKKVMHCQISLCIDAFSSVNIFTGSEAMLENRAASRFDLRFNCLQWVALKWAISLEHFILK